MSFLDRLKAMSEEAEAQAAEGGAAPPGSSFLDRLRAMSEEAGEIVGPPVPEGLLERQGLEQLGEAAAGAVAPFARMAEAALQPAPPLQRGETRLAPAPGVRGIPPQAVVTTEAELEEEAGARPDLERMREMGPFESPGEVGFRLASAKQEKARYRRFWERVTGAAEGAAIASGERQVPTGPPGIEMGMFGALGPEEAELPEFIERDMRMIDQLREENRLAAEAGDVSGSAVKEIEGIDSLVMKMPDIIAGYSLDSERELNLQEIADKANAQAKVLGYEGVNIMAADVAAAALDPVNHWKAHPVMDSLILLAAAPRALGAASSALLGAAGAVARTRAALIGPSRVGGVSARGERAIHGFAGLTVPEAAAEAAAAQGAARVTSARAIQEGAETAAKQATQRAALAEQKLTELGHRVRVTDKEVLESASRLPQSRGAYGGEVARAIMKDSRPVVLTAEEKAALGMAALETDAEISGIAAKINRLSKIADRSPGQQGELDALSRQMQGLQDRAVNIRSAIIKTQSEAGRAFRFSQVAFTAPTSVADLTAEWIALTGEAPGARVATLIERISKKMESGSANASTQQRIIDGAEDAAQAARASLEEARRSARAAGETGARDARKFYERQAAAAASEVKRLEGRMASAKRTQAKEVERVDSARRRLNRAKLRQAPVPYRIANAATSLLMETPAGLRSAGGVVDWSMLFTQSALVAAARPQYALLAGIETALSGIAGPPGARFAALGRRLELPLNNHLMGLYDPKRMKLYDKAGLRLREIPGVPSQFVMGEREMALGARMLEFMRDWPYFGPIAAAIEESVVLPAERMFAAFTNGMSIRLFNEFIGAQIKNGIPAQKIPLEDLRTAAYATNLSAGMGSWSPPRIPFLGPGNVPSAYAKNVRNRLMNPAQWFWSTRFTSAGLEFLAGAPTARGVLTGAPAGTQFAQRLWQQQMAAGMMMGGLFKMQGWEVDMSPEAGSLMGKAFDPETGEVIDFMGGRVQPARFVMDIFNGGYYTQSGDFKDFGTDIHASTFNRVGDFLRTKARPGLPTVMIDMFEDRFDLRSEKGTFDFVTAMGWQLAPLASESLFKDEDATTGQRIARAIGARSYTIGAEEPDPPEEPYNPIRDFRDAEIPEQIGEVATGLLDGIVRVIQEKIDDARKTRRPTQ